MLSHRILLVLGLTGWLALPAGAEAAAARPQIARVSSTTDVSQVASQGLGNLSGRYLTKFVDQVERSQDKVQVVWDAPVESAGTMTELFLDYRTHEYESTRSLLYRYERTRPGRQRTIFVLPIGETLSAWRVRLVQGGRIVDQKSSGVWK